MRVLLIGGGGREHALAWKIVQSGEVDALFCAPGNPGIAALPKTQCLPLAVDDFDAHKALIQAEGIQLVVVGPEDPLAEGIVDRLSSPVCRVFGPRKAAARLEASKAYAKAFMAKYDIPTAAYAEFDALEPALAYVRETGAPIVIKADGLAAGKGVTVAQTLEEAEAALRHVMEEKAFGDAGAKVVIEEFMRGEEASILAFADGKIAVPMASSQDHKAVYEGDQGPNTGGMGAYSPAPVVSDEMMAVIQREVLDRCIAGMKQEGCPYTGILYAGLMITDEGPKVVEFNCRFGDPETQVVLPRMKSDIIPLFRACCEGTLSQQTIEYDTRPCVTVVLASGGYPGSYEKGKPIQGIAEAEAGEGVVVFHAGTRMNDGVLVTNGGRVLNVTAIDSDLPATIAKAYEALDKISFEGAFCRRDIGQKALNRLG